MMDKIAPKDPKEKYILEDKDFLLIQALQELTRAIKYLANKNG